MKYISLILLIVVAVFGLQSTVTTTVIPTLSFSANELPIYCVDTSEAVVALTFDSAWGTEDLADILQILKNHNASATFFVTGEWAEKNPDAIISIDKAGHEIANHGNGHKHMPQLSKEEMLQEIQGCHDIVYNLIGKNMTLFRAPYSDWNDEVVEAAHSLGYMSINQSVDSLDWKDYGVDSIIRTVCQHKNLENGSIILLHNGATYTRDALDELLQNLENQGYSFVLVSELIYNENYTLDHTGKQFSAK
jgi:polysaccharide deacetylase family sporulation protein PdaB